MLPASWAMEFLAAKHHRIHLSLCWAATPLPTSALAGSIRAALTVPAPHGAGVSDAMRCGSVPSLQSPSQQQNGAGGGAPLGNGKFDIESTPVLVLGGHTFVHISAGQLHTCGIDGAGAAWCWGERVCPAWSR